MNNCVGRAIPVDRVISRRWRFVPFLAIGLFCGLATSWLVLRLRSTPMHMPATENERLTLDAAQSKFQALSATIGAMSTDARATTIKLVQDGINWSRQSEALMRDVRARLGVADDIAITLSGSEWVR